MKNSNVIQVVGMSLLMGLAQVGWASQGSKNKCQQEPEVIILPDGSEMDCNECIRLMGGDIPVPIRDNPLNYKFEFGNKDYYKLLGTVRTEKSGESFFEVDTKTHPWLTTDTHGRAKLYPLKSVHYDLSSYKNQRVQLLVQAHYYMDVRSKDNLPRIELDVVAQPIQSPAQAWKKR